jgi:hypothetical protein
MIFFPNLAVTCQSNDGFIDFDVSGKTMKKKMENPFLTIFDHL